VNTRTLLTAWILVQASLQRWGWFKPALVIFYLVLAIGWLGVVPQLKGAVDSAEQRLALEAQQAPAEPIPALVSVSETSQNFSQFREILGRAEDVPSYEKILLAEARSANLLLQQVSHSWSAQANAFPATVQVSMPIKGSFADIRSFCERILVALPFASLDEVAIRRESIAATTLDASLRLTLYLSSTDVSKAAK